MCFSGAEKRCLTSYARALGSNRVYLEDEILPQEQVELSKREVEVAATGFLGRLGLQPILLQVHSSRLDRVEGLQGPRASHL